MMEALAQVYEQPEVEQIDEQGGGNSRQNTRDSQERARQERETARINRDRTIQQAGGGDAAEKARIAYRKANPEKSSPLDPNPSSDDEVNAKFNTRVQGKASLTKLGGGNLDKGIEIFRKQQADAKAKTETENDKTNNGMTAAEIKAAQDAANKARRDGKLSDLRGSGNTTASTPKPTPTFKVGDKQMSKAEINKEYDRRRYSTDPKVRATAKDFGNTAFKATNKPAIGTTPGGTKFERRTPTSAELRAAQAARAAGKGDEGAVKSAVQQSQRQASVNAAIKSANRPEVLNKQAPTGSALRAQQDRLAQKNKIQREVAAVKSGMPANTQSSVQSTVKSGVQKAGVKVGDTVKTKVNPDSSMSVTQKRSAAATDKIKKSLDIQSADLFDIVKGEFINEGYSEEDTMYMMANLDENILRKLVIDPIIRAGRPLVTKGLQRVGKMFGRSPKPTRIPAGDIGAMRLRQGQATDAITRLNQSTAASKVRDSTRAAAREKTRLNNLDPRAVSDRNAREASSQVRQRNIEMGRPSWYNPNTPGSKEALKRYYADKRSGVKGLPE